MRRSKALAGILVALSLCIGCAASGGSDPEPITPAPPVTVPEPTSDEDRHTLAQLGDIAARDAELDGSAEGVECWLPSENMIDEAQWRVICRVHYEVVDPEARDPEAQDPDTKSTPRYRDMICIGDSARDPVADYCYEWAPYSDMPAFEDRPARSAPSAPDR